MLVPYHEPSSENGCEHTEIHEGGPLNPDEFPVAAPAAMKIMKARVAADVTMKTLPAVDRAATFARVRPARVGRDTSLKSLGDSSPQFNRDLPHILLSARIEGEKPRAIGGDRPFDS